MVNGAKCYGCRFLKTYLAELGAFCDYAEMKGQTRLGQMTDAQRRSGHCPFREPETDGQRVNPRHEEFFRLWKEGKNDREIARLTGADVSTVRRWRWIARLPTQQIQSTELAEEEFRRLYMQGWNDAQIARSVGCSSETVRRWRERERLPTQRKLQGQKGRSAFRRMYTRGWSDAQIARSVGCSSETVRRWRDYCGLPPH